MNLIKVGKLNFKFRSHGVIARSPWRPRQSDLFFNGLKFVFLFLLILTTISFFDLKKAKAEEIPSHEIVISELMWMGSSKSTADEWIELYNTTDETIDLSNWQLTNWNQGSGEYKPMLTIPAGNFIHTHDYFLISNFNKGDLNSKGELATILYIKPDLLFPSITLSNDNLQVKLYDNLGNSIDIAGDGRAPLKGSNTSPKSSMARNEIPGDGTQKTNWYSIINASNLINDVPDLATPQNSHNQPPNVPDLLLPNDNISITQGTNIQFSWLPTTDSENDDVFYSLFVGCSSAFDHSNLITVSNIGDNHYILNSKEIIDDIGICPVYYWAVKSSDGMSESILSPFRKLQIKYSKSIIVNELYPDPNSGESEWMELYNNSSETIDLENWILEDEDGNRQTITISLPISSFGFVLINSKISLNNDGDLIKLFDPNGKLVSSTPKYSTPKYLDGEKGWSWARGPDGEWSSTTTPTAGEVNIISLPKIDDPVLETEPVINTIPIEISTGDYQNYLDKLVKIRGKVISTSGNTFYLDDGSGVIKVYIQEKTGIVKPEMHRNDIFEIIGVVDLYGQTWRILPRTLNDIALIEKAPVVTKTATAKKTVVKKVVSKAVTAVKSPLISKAVAAASTSPPAENNDKNNTLSQLIKTSIGLAILFLVFLIIKILHQPKVKSIGGHFGDDET